MTTEIKLNTPCTIESKAGAGKLDGEIICEHLDGELAFKPKGCVTPLYYFRPNEWTISYPTPPIPPLPTEVGTVIESGGVRFMRDSENDWYSATPYGKSEGYVHSLKEITAYITSNGGFVVLLEGVKA